MIEKKFKIGDYYIIKNEELTNLNNTIIRITDISDNYIDLEDNECYTIYWQVVINPNESIFKRSYVNEMASNCSNIGSFIKLTDMQVKALKTTIKTFIDSIKF